jgi:hypothetical protein
MFKQKSNLPENLLPEILLLPFLSLFQPLFVQNSSIFRLNFVNKVYGFCQLLLIWPLSPLKKASPRITDTSLTGLIFL